MVGEGCRAAGAAPRYGPRDSRIESPSGAPPASLLTLSNDMATNCAQPLCSHKVIARDRWRMRMTRGSWLADGDSARHSAWGNVATGRSRGWARGHL
jgi:hypothetical protein